MQTIAPRILLFSLLLVVPMLGYGAATLLQASTRGEFHTLIREENQMLTEAAVAAISIEQACQAPSPLLQGICQEQKGLQLVRYGSLLAGMGGLVLPLGVLLAGWLSRLKSVYLARLFKPGLSLALTVLFLLLTLHAAIALTLLHYGLGDLPLFILGLIVIVAGGCLLAMGRNAFRLIRPARIRLVGLPLPHKEAPELWALVIKTVRHADALPPQHIVVGIDPGCFVSEAQVDALGGTLTGRTFYCSLPLCRLLSVNELAALLGHELRHFKGGSRGLSEHVFPLYRGTLAALAERRAVRHHPAWALMVWPTSVFLGTCLDSFAGAIQHHNRKREYAADRVGARVANSKTYALALVKLHYLSEHWEELRKAAAGALRQGPLPANLSAWYADSVAQGFDLSAAAADLAGSALSHPTDLHPPLAKRLHYLHENLSTVSELPCPLPPEDAALRLIPQAEALEEKLSAAYRVERLK